MGANKSTTALSSAVVPQDSPPSAGDEDAAAAEGGDVVGSNGEAEVATGGEKEQRRPATPATRDGESKPPSSGGASCVEVASKAEPGPWRSEPISIDTGDGGGAAKGGEAPPFGDGGNEDKERAAMREHALLGRGARVRVAAPVTRLSVALELPGRGAKSAKAQQLKRRQGYIPPVSETRRKMGRSTSTSVLGRVLSKASLQEARSTTRVPLSRQRVPRVVGSPSHNGAAMLEAAAVAALERSEAALEQPGS